jgi:hypothetical protein
MGHGLKFVTSSRCRSRCVVATPIIAVLDASHAVIAVAFCTICRGAQTAYSDDSTVDPKVILTKSHVGLSPDSMHVHFGCATVGRYWSSEPWACAV